MFVAVVHYFFCFVPSGIVHDEKHFWIFGVHAFEELEELFGVEFVAKHVVGFVVTLCTITVEVLAHVCELLHWFAAFEEPSACNFWLDAKRRFIQHKEFVALCYSFGNQASEFFLKRFCAALFAL